MKKALVVMIALLLAVPAVSFAGSATSRWDMTIGGAVKFDTGYVDQNANSNYNGSRRSSDTTNYQVGNYFMGTVETSINFFIKGPDTLGAKTSAFIQGDFTGGWGRVNAAGTYTGMIMKGQLDWTNTTIEFGTFPTAGGMYPTFGGTILSYGGMNQHDKGFPNTPQIVWTQRIGKALSFKVGAIDLTGPPGWQGGASSNNNSFSRTGYPGLEVQVAWTSDACGRIGPFQLGAKTNGTFGRERKLDDTGLIQAGGQVDSWYWDFAVIVPIIPEKNGNKAGALLVDGAYFTSQNPSAVNAPAPAHSGNLGDIAGGAQNGFWQGSYQRGHDWKAPVISGYAAHLAFYWTNSVFTNLFYGRTTANMSQALMLGAGINGVQNNQTCIANILWDVSPALRVGAEWENLNTRYASNAGLPGGSKKGTLNAYRIGAIYYF